MIVLNLLPVQQAPVVVGRGCGYRPRRWRVAVLQSLVLGAPDMNLVRLQGKAV